MVSSMNLSETLLSEFLVNALYYIIQQILRKIHTTVDVRDSGRHDSPLEDVNILSDVFNIHITKTSAMNTTSFFEALYKHIDKVQVLLD